VHEPSGRTLRGGGEPKPAVAPARAVEPGYAIPTVEFDPERVTAGFRVLDAGRIPTVKFDPKRVTEAVKVDLKKNIRKIKEFDESHFDKIYEAALRSISGGRDMATLFNAITELNLPGMTKQRASDISGSLNNKATALMDQNRQESLSIKYAIWMYSGAPCQTNPKKPSAKDIRQDAAHKAANGKRYEVAKGMLLNGRYKWPGQDEGCRCASRSIIPGLDP
jgi:uncharacterized protein with gpF-like domain